jgi:hypothetical protein
MTTFSRLDIFSPRQNTLRIRPVSRSSGKKIARDFRAVTEKGCRITGDFSSPPFGGRILPRMMRTQSGANWSGVLSLSHLWMAALLRLSAMFVCGAVSFLRMRPSRLPGECHADVTPQTLPSANSGSSKKAEPAEASSQTNMKTNTSHRGSFSGKARSAASRESRFERQWDRRNTAQSPSSSNRDFRDARSLSSGRPSAGPVGLPENDSGCGCTIHPGSRL